MNRLSSNEISLIRSRNQDRIGRGCDPQVILSQMGLMNLYGVSGGKWSALSASDGSEIGVILPCGESRAVEVILNGSDLYEVRRVRLVNKGQQKGTVVVEIEVLDVFCENLGDAVYSASCWK